jgi:hypothetical protein
MFWLELITLNVSGHAAHISGQRISNPDGTAACADLAHLSAMVEP